MKNYDSYNYKIFFPKLNQDQLTNWGPGHYQEIIEQHLDVTKPDGNGRAPTDMSTSNTHSSSPETSPQRYFDNSQAPTEPCLACSNRHVKNAAENGNYNSNFSNLESREFNEKQLIDSVALNTDSRQLEKAVVEKTALS